MKVVLRRHPDGKLFVRKVTNVFDVIGEEVVGFYPDEDLLPMTTDVDTLDAIHRRLAKIGGAEHPITGRVSNAILGVIARQPAEECPDCGKLMEGKCTDWLCRIKAALKMGSGPRK